MGFKCTAQILKPVHSVFFRGVGGCISDVTSETEMRVSAKKYHPMTAARTFVFINMSYLVHIFAFYVSAKKGMGVCG